LIVLKKATVDHAEPTVKILAVQQLNRLVVEQLGNLKYSS